MNMKGIKAKQGNLNYGGGKMFYNKFPLMFEVRRGDDD